EPFLFPGVPDEEDRALRPRPLGHGFGDSKHGDRPRPIIVGSAVDCIAARLVPDADVIVMRANGEVLILEPRVAAFEYPDDVLRLGLLQFDAHVDGQLLAGAEVEGGDGFIARYGFEHRAAIALLALKYGRHTLL